MGKSIYTLILYQTLNKISSVSMKKVATLFIFFTVFELKRSFIDANDVAAERLCKFSQHRQRINGIVMQISA